MAVSAELTLEIAKFKAGLASAVSSVHSFKGEAETAGVELGKAIGEGIKKELSGGGVTGGLFGNILGSIGALGGAAGVITAIKGATSGFRDMDLQAQKLGATVEEVQRLGAVARFAKVDVETLGNTLLRLEKSLGAAEEPKIAEALHRLGLDAAQLEGMSLDQKILSLSSAFQKGREEGTGMHDMAQLLGRSFTELIPILSTNTEKIREMMDAVKPVDSAMVEMMAHVDEMLEKQERAVTKRGRGILGMAALGLESLFHIGDSGRFQNKEAGEIEDSLNREAAEKTGHGIMAQIHKRKNAGDIEGLQRLAQAMQNDQRPEYAAVAQQAIEQLQRFQKLADAHDIPGLKSFKDEMGESGETGLAHKAELIIREEELRKHSIDRISEYEKRIRETQDSDLPETQRFQALEKEKALLMEQKNKTGGINFDNTNEGLQQWADALKQHGHLPEAENALKLLQESVRLTKEMDHLASHMRETAAKEAEERAKANQRLREITDKQAIHDSSPHDQVAQHLANLKQIFGFAGDGLPGTGDIAKGLKKLQDEADAAHAKGDLAGEGRALKKLKAARDEAEALGHDYGTKAPMGALGGQINALLGKSHSELVAQHTGQMVDLLHKIDANLQNFLRSSGGKADLPKPSPWIMDNGTFTN